MDFERIINNFFKNVLKSLPITKNKTVPNLTLK